MPAVPASPSRLEALPPFLGGDPSAAIDAVLTDEFDFGAASDDGFAWADDSGPHTGDDQRDVAQSLDDAAIFEAERDPAAVGDEGELDITDHGQPVVVAGEPGLNGVKAAFGIATLAFAVCVGQGLEQPRSREQRKAKTDGRCWLNARFRGDGADTRSEQQHQEHSLC